MPARKEDYTDLPLKANPTQNFFLSSASVSSYVDQYKIKS